VLTAVVALHVLLQISNSVFGNSSRVSAFSYENSLPKFEYVGYLSADLLLALNLFSKYLAMTIMQADVGIAAWKACSAILILKVHKHF
jgi:hypothetical protein